MNRSSVSATRLMSVGAIGAASAALANTAIFGLGRAGDVAFIAKDGAVGPDYIHWVHVVSLSLFTMAIGVVVALVASWVGKPSLRTMQVIGAVFAVVSTEMDVSIDSSVAAKLLLASMHLVVGVAYGCSLELASRRDPVRAQRVLNFA
jgi:hypothetical protein